MGPWHVRQWSWRLVASAILLVASVAKPAPAMAVDCNGEPGRPNDVASVQGTTFTGTYLGQRDGLETWAVDRWYAGALPGIVTYPRGACYPLDFDEGVRYLFSTSDPSSPTSYDTVAYRILDGDRVRLVRFEAAVPHELYPDALRTMSFEQAIEVLAPTALAPSPDGVGLVIAFIAWLIRALQGLP